MSIWCISRVSVFTVKGIFVHVSWCTGARVSLDFVPGRGSEGHLVYTSMFFVFGDKNLSSSTSFVGICAQISIVHFLFPLLCTIIFCLTSPFWVRFPVWLFVCYVFGHSLTFWWSKHCFKILFLPTIWFYLSSQEFTLECFIHSSTLIFLSTFAIVV